MKRLGLLITTLIIGTPVLGQTPRCAPRALVVEKLATYGESQTGMGLQGANRILEIWSSASTGSWTVLMTFTDGRSCVMAAGEGWTGGTITPEPAANPA